MSTTAVMDRPAVAEDVLDETSDAARCSDCSHLPGECPCPHFCVARGAE